MARRIVKNVLTGLRGQQSKGGIFRGNIIKSEGVSSWKDLECILNRLTLNLFEGIRGVIIQDKNKMIFIHTTMLHDIHQRKLKNI